MIDKILECIEAILIVFVFVGSFVLLSLWLTAVCK
jgi:hypothetical protein